MNEHHYQRMDKGQKRGETRQEDRREPRSDKGKSHLYLTPERRAAILAEVPDAIRTGESTTQIAARHGIPASSLRAWLIGDEATEQARADLLANELAIRTQDIDDAIDPLSLARAREGFRAWAWIAERREARLYGQKQEVTHNVQQPVLQITIVQMPVDNSVVAEQLPQCTTLDNIHRLS